MSTPAARATNATSAYRPTFEVGTSLPDAVLVSLYRLDNGSAADDTSAVNGTVVGTWDATNTGSLAVGVGGTSMYKAGGTPHITFPASNAAHNLTRLSLSFYYQPQFNSNKHVLFACASTGASAAGDLSIERLTNGRLRAWHVGQDGGLRFFESTDGIAATNLVTGTAYRITATFGLGGAKLYLNNTLVASIPQNTNGWNNTRVKYLGVWVDGAADPAQGLLDHVRIWNGELQASGVSALEAAQSVSPPSTGEFITTPEDHGWDAGNTDQQNTGFFQDAVDFASANAGSSGTGRGVVELVQGKLYTVRVASNGTSSSAPVNAITAKNNVEIRTAGQPTRSSGNQAIIKWHSWAGFGTASIKHRNLLYISNVSNFRCGYVEFHGNKNTMANNTVMDYSSGTNGGMSGISVRNSVTNIVVREVTSHHCGTDALLCSPASGNNVLFEDCDFNRSRRQGMSMGRCFRDTGTITFDMMIFRRCNFINNGDHPGDIVGLQPGWGVDIEPDQTSESVHGVTFDDCLFDQNWGSTHINEVNVGQGDRNGFMADCRATINRLKIINCVGSNHLSSGAASGKGFGFALRGNPTWSNMIIENNVSQGNSLNRMGFSGETGGNGGTLVNLDLINNNVNQLLFTAGLNASGHSVEIWKGNFNPTVTTNGKTTITINNGFPP